MFHVFHFKHKVMIKKGLGRFVLHTSYGTGSGEHGCVIFVAISYACSISLPTLACKVVIIITNNPLYVLISVHILFFIS